VVACEIEKKKQPRRTKLRFQAEVIAEIEFSIKIGNVKGTRV